MLKENERIDDLQINGERIIQKKQGFCFGIDAVLLANFVKVKRKEQKLIDLGTGNGVIPIIIAAKTSISEIHGVEIQEEISEMAERSVILNDMQNRVFIHNMDIKNVDKNFQKESFDIVTSNPPYMLDKKMPAENKSKAIARQEILINLDELFSSVNYLLKPNGKFFLVHRPSRLADIFCEARKYKIEPKKICLVHPKVNKPPNIVLIEFTKNGQSEIKFLEPLYVHEEDGSYTESIKKIYYSK